MHEDQRKKTFDSSTAPDKSQFSQLTVARSAVTFTRNCFRGVNRRHGRIHKRSGRFGQILFLVRACVMDRGGAESREVAPRVAYRAIVIVDNFPPEEFFIPAASHR
ncbi:hypothetical protein X777_16888 [Ooceraea biroi]|uniref:Uncharacterized protein n=1 Tax=Ooceraea biroi TaxID=2015173 RepID=A0A026WUZ8_OOCBI|nr:hypothetical protein X777_16888 [Ooceraea biroi]